MTIISPSLLAADFTELRQEVINIEKAGADWLHLDVMDGHFVPNLTFGPQIIKSLRPLTNLVFDVHLMVNCPDKMIDWFAKAGADIITVHFEACENPADTLQKIKSLGKKCGLSLCPQTNAEVLIPYLDNLDLILVMTVNPGFGGQKFMSDQLCKIEKIKSFTKEKNIIIEVDGGINAENAVLCKNAGATALVAGSYIFGSDNYREKIESLKKGDEEL